MVEEQPLGNFEDINRTLQQLGYPYRLALVEYERLEFLQKNARYMTNEQFKNLTDNIKKDGALSSVPFCWLKPDGKFKVLSGNHRLQAGHSAGISQFLILYTAKELSQQEQVSIQLSHNAIEGKDDPVILTELWKEIADVELKYYSGLDDKLMQELEKVSLAPLSEVNLDFRAISIVFLPEELERVKEAFANALKMVSGDEVFLARMKEYDQMMDALAKTQASYDVKNIATSLMLILDLFQRHQTDLAEGWQEEAEPSKTRSWVPLASIFGTDLVPASAAQVIQKAAQRMMDSGEIAKKNLWQVIEYWAAEYLAGAIETRKANKEGLN